MHRTDASGRVEWRPVVLIFLALMAAAIATYSLLIDPPHAPPTTSYLPPTPME